jgi:hypothetical protein
MRRPRAFLDRVWARNLAVLETAPQPAGPPAVP